MVDWSEGPEGLDANTEFGVRWTGEVEAQLSEAVTFLTYQRGGVRLWIDGEQRIYGWNESSRQWQSEPIQLQAGDRVPVQLDYFTTSEKPACSFLWESYTQERERVPTAYLYPESVEIATRPDARPATERIEAVTFDVSSGDIRRGNRLGGVRQKDFSAPGAYAGYRRIDFGDGVTSVRALARGAPAGDADFDVTLEFRIGDRDGDAIATLSMRDGNLRERTASVGDVSGVEDLYVVNTTVEKWHGTDLRWFTFE
jgi:hypothetical protein